MKPTTMLFRNLMSMDVEECIRAYPSMRSSSPGMRRTVPAQLMGAASAGIPAIMATGGPAPVARFRGKLLSTGTDLWHYVEDLRSGRMTLEEFDELEGVATRPCGHCNEMGTASSMTCIVEALGMCLAGTATIPALDADRPLASEETGRRAVELAREGLRPAEILTAKAFDNAITLLAGIGGSTNVVLHLLALAGRVGVPLSLGRFDELSRRTPLLVNVLPSGEHLVRPAQRGVPGSSAIKSLLHLDAVTVSRHIGRRASGRQHAEWGVVSAVAKPLDRRWDRGRPGPAPRRRCDQRRAASAGCSAIAGRQSGRQYDVRTGSTTRPRGKSESVLVLRARRRACPRVGPGADPRSCFARGYGHGARVRARMSGTAFGTVVLHVAPG
jgi:dihydroxy-acid dehydratase